MRKKILVCLAAVGVATACSNMLPDSTQTIKAYPNPYNPNAGVLTIENLDSSDFSKTQNDFIVYDFALNEIYRANILPIAADKKLVWAGIDNAGIKVSPGVYYLKVIRTTNAGAANTDSMFKLVVQ